MSRYGNYHGIHGILNVEGIKKLLKDPNTKPELKRELERKLKQFENDSTILK